MVVKQVIDHSLREAGRRFITSLKASNRYSGSYLASLETTVAMAALFAEEKGWPYVREITVSHMEEYLAYLQGRTRWFGARENVNPGKLSKGHINCQYRRLHRFFNWLLERGFINENPLHLIKPPSLDEKTVPVVTEEQIRDLLTLTDPALARTPAHRFRLARDRALLYMLWDTPGRLAEISELRLEDLDLEKGAVLVMGKGRRERWMPIGDSATSVLWDYLQERETVFTRSSALWVSEHGKAIMPNGIFQVLKRLGKRAGISNPHTHRFRHSYAVNALRAGMPERVLQIVGGWKKIPDTYFRTLGAEDAIQFHRQVSPGDRLGKPPTVKRARRLHVQDQPRGLAGKPLAGFCATPSRRIPVLCGIVVYVLRFMNQLLHR